MYCVYENQENKTYVLDKLCTDPKQVKKESWHALVFHMWLN